LVKILLIAVKRLLGTAGGCVIPDFYFLSVILGTEEEK
jgi:hypothetical protein